MVLVRVVARALVAYVALALLVLGWNPGVETVVVERERVVARVVEVEKVVESRFAVANRPTCPPPRTDAPHVSPDLPEPITGVRPATSNAGWIAAWNAEHVFVSLD